MTKDIPEVNTAVLTIVLLVVIVALVTADLIADWETGVRPGHLLIEAGTALIAAGGVVALILRLRALSRERRQLEQQLATSQDAARRWRMEAADLLAGLASAIDRQFDRWQLTPAERDIALMLLRGMSHKQIAGTRSASERTVRQQAHLLYRKAGLTNRADLAAFFLDGFSRPQDAQASGR